VTQKIEYQAVELPYDLDGQGRLLSYQALGGWKLKCVTQVLYSTVHANRLVAYMERDVLKR